MEEEPLGGQVEEERQNLPNLEALIVHKLTDANSDTELTMGNIR